MAIEASTLNVDVAHDFDSALEGAAGGTPLHQEWEELLASAVSNVVFLTWQWQRTWWLHFGRENRSDLHLLTIRSRSGQLVGIAPLYIAEEPVAPTREYVRGDGRPEGEGAPRRVVRIIGGTEVADYLDLIASAGMLREVWAVVLDYLQQCRESWDLIDLHSLPQWSASRDLLPQLAADRGLSCQVFPEDVCPVVELPGDFETYLMSLRKKDRHELRRKIRKLEGREDVRWFLASPTSPEEMHAATRTFLDLHRKSGADKAHFMNEQMASFFLSTVEDMLSTGWLDVAILEVDKQPAAAYFSFNYNGRIYLYNSGYDPRFSSYSAGIALLVYRIHKAINQGCKVFDFLRGDEEYKYDFGGKDTFVFRAIIK